MITPLLTNGEICESENRNDTLGPMMFIGDCNSVHRGIGDANEGGHLSFPVLNNDRVVLCVD
jgi:hypothetical protein